jgi:hypothetical protein
MAGGTAVWVPGSRLASWAVDLGMHSRMLTQHGQHQLLVLALAPVIPDHLLHDAPLVPARQASSLHPGEDQGDWGRRALA